MAVRSSMSNSDNRDRIERFQKILDYMYPYTKPYWKRSKDEKKPIPNAFAEEIAERKALEEKNAEKQRIERSVAAMKRQQYQPEKDQAPVYDRDKFHKHGGGKR